MLSVWGPGALGSDASWWHLNFLLPMLPTCSLGAASAKAMKNRRRGSTGTWRAMQELYKSAQISPTDERVHHSWSNSPRVCSLFLVSLV